MKIKITTDRMPWANGKPQHEGAELDVADAEADALIERGFAVAVKVAKPKKADE